MGAKGRRGLEQRDPSRGVSGRGGTKGVAPTEHPVSSDRP